MALDFILSGASSHPKCLKTSSIGICRRIPMELVRLYPGRTIDLRMERKSEPYKAPKPKPFSGHGQRLGDIVPPVLGAGVVGQKANVNDPHSAKDTGTSGESCFRYFCCV